VYTIVSMQTGSGLTQAEIMCTFWYYV